MMKAFDVSVAVFVRGLTNLKALLTKGESHALSRGTDPAALLGARLADDMYTLATQVHWAGEGAKLAVHRLINAEPAARADDARSFAALHERIDETIGDLGAVVPAALEAGLERTIEIQHRGTSKSYRGDLFLTEFAIPGFFFHLTTVYAILRKEGVPLQKGDFMGP